MTKTTCHACGAKCDTISECDGNGLSRLKALPQPDLTKLRKEYEKHMLLVNESAEKIRVDKTKKEVLQEQILDSFTEVIQAVKEVLDAEASDS